MFIKKCLLSLSFFMLFSTTVWGQKNKKCKPESNEFLFVLSNPNTIRDNGFVLEINMSSKLYIQGNPGTEVEFKQNKYIIPSSGFLVIKDSLPIVPEGISNEVLQIKSNSTIYVNVERTSEYSSHAFSLLPVSEWGREYVIAGYEDKSNKYKTKNFIDIIAYNKPTHITIKDNKGRVIEKFNLNPNQNFEYTSYEDLTGYSVAADNGIGVISGNHCLEISSACDHVALMIPDNTKLNTKYYNPATSFFSEHSIHRIVATKNNTKIIIDGKRETTLAKGEFYEYKKESPHIIDASSPVLVYFILDRKHNNPEFSIDPSFVLLPGINKGIRFTNFSFPNYMSYGKSVSLIMKTNRTSTLLLDGLSLSDLQWKEFPYDSSISYAFLNFEDTYTHTLSVSTPSSFFIPLMVARGEYVSLGTTLKLGYANLLTEKFDDCKDEFLPIPIVEGGVEETSIFIPQPLELMLTDSNIPINVETETIVIKVFDDAEEDGDIISIYLNKELIYSNVRVLKTGVFLKVELETGENTITIKAENEGKIYPNTAGLTIDDEHRKQTIILRNKKGYSSSLKIISK